MIFSTTKDTSKIRVNEGKLVTEDYIKLTLDYIMQELINVQLKYQNEYGELVLLFDDYKKDYWRKDVHSGYKSHRKNARDESNINYPEVFSYINALVKHLEEDTPWKCITVNRAEADDTILVLSREFCEREKILIYSPDKDFLQAQRFTNNVFQYSALTKKWLVPEHKHESMDHWVLEHCMLGDVSDGVPKVVDHTIFSENFINHLNKNDVPAICQNVHHFKFNNDILTEDNKINILQSFNIQKQNRKGKDIGLDIYKNEKFGPSTLQKVIVKHGSLNKFLDTNPLYRIHYDRNFQLVMEEGIPEYIWKNTMTEFNQAKTSYNKDNFDTYLDEIGLFGIKNSLIKVFTISEELSISNCGW